MSVINFPEGQMECFNLIGGKWKKGSGDTKDIYSPLNGKKIGQYFCSTKNDINEAIEIASAAQSEWANQSLKARCQVMFRLREILMRDADKISNIVSIENGKTFNEAKAGLMKGIEVLEYAISLQNVDMGGKMEVSRGVYCEYRREAVGVIASITPFNFPAMVPMWTLPIAITLGNAYVWKPSEKTPLTSLVLGQAFIEAGLPNGILTIIQGERESVEEIIDHKTIEAVGFVGSSKVAKQVYVRATSLGKRALCLGGAKNHIILLPDANPEIAGQGIADSFTGCAGQRCMAASVLLAVGDVDKQINKIVETAKNTTVCDKMGAIITKEQVEFLNGAIDKAVADGATLLVDGRNPEVSSEFKDGYWLAPTILDNLKPDSEAAHLELFGPVLGIVRCKTITEAIEIENENDYGNAASVFTTNGAMADLVAKNAKVGMVGINIGVPVPREPFSFGGVNESKFGFGDITGDHSLSFWTHIKKITTKWEMQNDANWMS